ncbi:hypothetical protein DTL70_06775 [Streptomyces diacarni]|uniref:Uncharacterized protein n=1 Tax=Streptomyces diacarni TaxID=2800381 RepID=A0A367F9C6_9ACTN|nr:hypothetical protein [Streptomyces diacarni]RCG26295.1 hypothetical protein DTL70_06775 [Streptomyces diacarni]
MPWLNRADLTAGEVTIPDAQWSAGVLYDHGPRKDAPGRGGAIELPVVLELLDRIDSGQITPAQARHALHPVLADLTHYHREMDGLEAMMNAN